MDNETTEVSTKMGIFILIWFFVDWFGLLICYYTNHTEDYAAFFASHFLLLIAFLLNFTGSTKRILLNALVSFFALFF